MEKKREPGTCRIPGEKKAGEKRPEEFRATGEKKEKKQESEEVQSLKEQKLEVSPLLENGLSECTCVKTGCERHGDCTACTAHHEGRRYPPYCKGKGRKKADRGQKKTGTGSLKQL